MQPHPLTCLAVLALLGETAILGNTAEAEDLFPVIETEQAFMDRCERDLLAHDPGAATWAGSECWSRWQAADAAGPMAEALLTLSRFTAQTAPPVDEVRAKLGMVQWTGADTGTLGDLGVALSWGSTPGISFAWYEIGAYGRYNLIDALRSRGAVLKTLGCPQYPGASMGQEKVVQVVAENRPGFTLTVYSRAAPTAIEPGIYEVHADFGGVIPTRAALQSGAYPGGGGRAFAVDPAGWVFECADP